METKYVGMVVAPGASYNIVNSIKDNLPNVLSEQISNEYAWEIDIVTDPLTGAAESVTEMYRATEAYFEEREWHYTICITDLPIYHGEKIIAVDINNTTDVGLISTPVYAIPPSKGKMRQSIVTIIKFLRGEYTEEEKPNIFSRLFTTIRLHYGTSHLPETQAEHTIYYMNNNVRGVSRLMGGMTWANNPFNMMRSLSNVVALAFATGTFGMIFSTMWNLSNLFPTWRLVIISIIAVTGMILWIIVSHNLWEPKESQSHQKIRKLYNGTTVFTLLISLTFYFVILYSLFLTGALVLLPEDYIVQNIEADGINVVFYLEVAWFATALSTVAGAIGTSTQDTDLIRESTYGYRQRFRYKQSNSDKTE